MDKNCSKGSFNLLQISESLSGPRTNDKELEKKMEEMKQNEKGLLSLKNIVFNFTKYFESIPYYYLEILSYNREISECIFLLFDKNEEFKEFASSLTSVHMDNNRQFQTIVLINFFIQVNEVNELNKTTHNWENYFSEAMVNSQLNRYSINKEKNQEKSMIIMRKNQKNWNRKKMSYIEMENSMKIQNFSNNYLEMKKNTLKLRKIILKSLRKLTTLLMT